MNSSNNLVDQTIYINVFNYLYLVVIIVGTLANIMAFIIFSRKKFENTLFSTYFRVLLVIDTIGLLYLTLAKYLFLAYKINIRDLNLILCRITMPMAYSIPTISAHLTVVISFDRWLSIAKPTLFLIRKTKKFQLNVCVMIILVNFVYNGQLFFSYIAIDPYENYDWEICLILNENLLSTMDLINSTILPFFLMILFTSLTINSVFVSTNRIRNAIFGLKISPINSDLISECDKFRYRDIRLTINSIFLNIIFLLFNAPQSIFFFISKYFIIKSHYSNLYVQSVLILSYLNHASSFFINLTVNTQFRKELFSWFNEKIITFSKQFPSKQSQSIN